MFPPCLMVCWMRVYWIPIRYPFCPSDCMCVRVRCGTHILLFWLRLLTMAVLVHCDFKLIYVVFWTIKSVGGCWRCGRCERCVCVWCGCLMDWVCAVWTHTHRGRQRILIGFSFKTFRMDCVRSSPLLEDLRWKELAMYYINWGARHVLYSFIETIKNNILPK